MKYLTKEEIVNYIFSHLNEEEEERITEILLNNDEEQEVVNYLIDLCLEKKFSESQLNKYLSEIIFENQNKRNRPRDDEDGDNFDMVPV